MKLTKAQIQQLYTFTQKHYVDWYDVQTELVDHLANGIENHLKQNPNTTFDSALNSEFKKFGVMGFSDVIEEKTKALNKRYRILVWKYYKGFFKLPKILLTLFLMWLIFFTLKTIDERVFVVIPTVLFITITPIWFLVVQTKRINKLKDKTGKKWLFDSVALQLGGLVYIINVVVQGLLFPNGAWSINVKLLFSITIVLFGLAVYISIFIVSPKLRKEMANQYPEYKFA
ncbi:hypothetical protein [Winogradskyella sp. PG-2]|uniref:hypothetical protein n=1 Tax=Winogradskyella sp. PG-2 TaxID=754409 RepID=UPI000458806A|nr:hypothetical protein [Winogradskyella sp. PG-2]BAO75599.1 hypothetical protein WPG_1369 [Winogradskyella sp. PG-2]